MGDMGRICTQKGPTGSHSISTLQITGNICGEPTLNTVLKLNKEGTYAEDRKEKIQSQYLERFSLDEIWDHKT